MIPPSTKESIDNYVQFGYHPGEFVSAVLCNDLVGAVGHADLENLPALTDIVKYIYNHIPGGVWGTREKVEAHLKSFRA